MKMTLINSNKNNKEIKIPISNKTAFLAPKDNKNRIIKTKNK